MPSTIRLFLFCIIGLSTTACYTISDFHEAKVLEHRESAAGVTTGYFVQPEQNGTFALDGCAFYRRGIGRNSEMTYRMSWQMTFRTDYKYQFHESKNGELALASGLNLEMGLVNFDGNVGILRPQVPFYLSYHPADRLSFYGNVKYNLQIPGFDGASLLHLMSYNSGVRFGKNYGIMIELSHAPEYNSILNAPPNLLGLSQVHGAIFFKF